MAADQAESKAAKLKEAIENIRKDFFKINESKYKKTNLISKFFH
jgi:hypothetical protein